MHLIPTQEEVVQLLRGTGALREGFFEYPNGLYSNQYLQVALAMSSFQVQNTLGVGLSRLVRANSEIRAVIPELSIVTPATGGLPVAYSVCEALRAKRVYWAERQNDDEPLEFRQFLQIEPGEKVLLVDDILRSGQKLSELKRLVESKGGEVVGLAVIVYQPNPHCASFGSLPLYYLAKLDSLYCEDKDSCAIGTPGTPPVKVRQ
ncbi:MAG TPA: phosphoribosyltransferase family protein [Bryobacteraceae bacterium]|nr:phosphoribosyltransferase family protein [Bryobacteraceae bacterium]